jgi:hypothetical protein
MGRKQLVWIAALAVGILTALAGEGAEVNWPQSNPKSWRCASPTCALIVPYFPRLLRSTEQETGNIPLA